jgi:hypothetical protein
MCRSEEREVLREEGVNKTEEHFWTAQPPPLLAAGGGVPAATRLLRKSVFLHFKHHWKRIL